jgi:hypothetical protein
VRTNAPAPSPNSAARAQHATGCRERREKARAGAADVEGPGVFGTERVRDLRRGVGHHRVLAAARDEHQIDLRALHAGVCERSPPGRRRQLGQPRTGLGVAAFVDPGAPHDPVVVNPDRRGDLGVGHDAIGKRAA